MSHFDKQSDSASTLFDSSLPFGESVEASSPPVAADQPAAEQPAAEQPAAEQPVRKTMPPKQRTEPEMRKSAYTTAESLKMEGEKGADQICLFHRGTFLRAYNRSACLISSLFRPGYKILRDKTAMGESYVYLGFPHSKMEEVFDGKCDIKEHDMFITVTLPQDMLKLAQPYDKWLGEARISDQKETDLPHEANTPLSASMHIGNSQEIALRLATYHMENHTMIESMHFLADLISSIEYKK